MLRQAGRHASARLGAVAALVALAAVAAFATNVGACGERDSRPPGIGSAGAHEPGRGDDGDPDAGDPLIAITAELEGATAETIERTIVEPIEAVLELRPGVRSIRSTIRDGRGVVMVKIDRRRDLNAVFPALQRAVSGIRSILPAGLPAPKLALGDPDAPPAIWLAASGPIAALQLSETARGVILPRLQRLPGVRDVEIRDETTRAVTIRLDPARLDAFGITLADVQTVLGRALDRGAGRHVDGPTDGAPRDLSAVGAVELARRSGAPIRLLDVATIEDGILSRPEATSAPPMLGIRILPGADRNQVLAAIRAAVLEVSAMLPAGCVLAEAPALPRDERRPRAIDPTGEAPRRAGDAVGVPSPRDLASPIDIAVRGSDWTTLEHLADALARDLRARRVLVSAVASDHRVDAPQPVITADLDRASRLGVSPAEIAATVRGLTIGPGKLPGAVLDVPIVLRIGAHDQPLPAALDQVRVRTARGERVPLSAVATVTMRPGVVITHRDRERAITISVTPIAGPLRDVVRHKIAALTRDLPAGYRATLTHP